MTVLISRGVVMESAWRCTIFQVSAKRVRERDIVALRVKLHRWIWIATRQRHLS